MMRAFLFSLSSFATLVFLTGCASSKVAQQPGNDWQQRTGQILFSYKSTRVVADVAVRHTKKDLIADVSKGGAAHLLTVSTLPDGLVEIRGPMARGTWKFEPERGLGPLKAWSIFPKTFLSAAAKAGPGQPFQFSTSGGGAKIQCQIAQ